MFWVLAFWFREARARFPTKPTIYGKERRPACVVTTPRAPWMPSCALDSKWIRNGLLVLPGFRCPGVTKRACQFLFAKGDRDDGGPNDFVPEQVALLELMAHDVFGEVCARH